MAALLVAAACRNAPPPSSPSASAPCGPPPAASGARATGGRQVLQTGHTSEITAAAVDREGTVIATGDRGGMVLLWDASTLAVIARIQVGTVSELSFAPDAPELHVLHQLDDESGGMGKSTSGGSISVFDASGRLLHLVPGVYQTAEPLAGGRWAALTTDKELLVLDRKACAVEHLPSPCNPYGCLGLSSSRDGRWLGYVDTSDLDKSTTVVREARPDAAPILSVPRTDDFFVRADGALVFAEGGKLWLKAPGAAPPRALAAPIAKVEDFSVIDGESAVLAQDGPDWVAWELATGAPRWRVRESDVAFAWSSGSAARPGARGGLWLASGAIVGLRSPRGELVVLDAKTGRTRGRLGGGAVVVPLAARFAGGDLITQAATRASRWSLTRGERVATAPASLGDVVRPDAAGGLDWLRATAVGDGDARGLVVFRGPPLADLPPSAPLPAPQRLPGARRLVSVDAAGVRAHAVGLAGELVTLDLASGVSMPLDGLRDDGRGARISEGGGLVLSRTEKSVAVHDARTGARLGELAGFTAQAAGMTGPSRPRFSDARERALCPTWASDHAMTGTMIHFLGRRKDALPRLAVTSDDKAIVLEDVAGALHVHRLGAAGFARAAAESLPIAHRTTALAWLGRGPEILVGTADGKVLVVRDGKIARAIATDGGEIHALASEPSGERFVALSADGGARLFAKGADTPLATFVEFEDDEHLAFTPGGAYAGTPEAAARVGWAYDGPPEGFRFEQFASRFAKPEIVRARLRGGASDAPPLDARPPRAELTDARVVGDHARLRVRVESALRVDQVAAFVEGRPAGAQRACTPRGDVEVDVPLTPGSNRVVLTAFDARGFGSNALSVDLTSAAAGARPDVHLVAFGVSKYPQLPPQYQLDLAAVDATGIAKALRAQVGPGRPFAALHETVLVDEQVTVPAALRALSALEAVKPGDLAIVFFAGHGIKPSADEDMVFLTSASASTAASARANGIGWREVGAAIARAKGRVLVLLDACHSGHLTQELVVPNDALASSLAHQERAGAVVFAAAKGRQVSFEPGNARGFVVVSEADVARAPDGPHGYFTGAVLSALDDPRVDKNGDGLVQLSEMIEAVTARVSDATANRQTPWVARRELFGDFALARLGARPASVPPAPPPREARECPEGDRPTCERYCAAGNVASCVELGFLLLDAEPERALALFRRSCAERDATACSNVGYMVEHGKGGASADPKEALRLYVHACELGGALGCQNAAVMLAAGRGAPKDEASAYELAKGACFAGRKEACLTAGRAARAGRGVAASAVTAGALLDRACRDGDRAGCVELASLLAGTDAARAADARGRACKLGAAELCGR